MADDGLHMAQPSYDKNENENSDDGDDKLTKMSDMDGVDAEDNNDDEEDEYSDEYSMKKEDFYDEADEIAEADAVVQDWTSDVEKEDAEVVARIADGKSGIDVANTHGGVEQYVNEDCNVILDVMRDQKDKATLDVNIEGKPMLNKWTHSKEHTNNNEQVVADAIVEQWTDDVVHDDDKHIDDDDDDDDDVTQHNEVKHSSGEVCNLPEQTPHSVTSDYVAVVPAAYEQQLAASNAETLRLKNEVEESRLELELLEASVAQFRTQLKQAREQVREQQRDNEATNLHTKNVHESELNAIILREQHARLLLGKAYESTERLELALREKEQDFSALQSAHEQCSACLRQLQTDLDRERLKSRNLIDRFNQVKDLELQRQRQKFVDVSEKQKAVFTRLKQRYTDACANVISKQEKIDSLIHQLEQTCVSNTVLTQRAKSMERNQAVLDNDRMQASQQFVVERTTLADKLAASENELEAVSLQLSNAIAQAEARAKETLATSSMSIKFDCLHSANPEIGESIVALTVECGDIDEWIWARSFAGSMFIDIPGVQSSQYTACVDDIGAVLKATCRNKEGHSCSSEIGPICLSDNIACVMHDFFLSKKDVSFQVKVNESIADTSQKQQQNSLVLTRDKLKLKAGRRTQVKYEYMAAMHVEIDTSSSGAFNVLFAGGINPAIHLSVDTHTQRDLIVLMVRCFHVMHLSKYAYKEKDVNILLLEFLVRTSNSCVATDSNTNDIVLHTRRNRNTMGARQRSFTISRSAILQVPNHHACEGRHSHDGVSSIDLSHSLGSMVLESTREDINDDIVSHHKNIDINHNHRASQSIKYDEDGYIIREQDEAHSDAFQQGIHSDNDNDCESVSNAIMIEPIVIKPMEEAVEASPEELSRAALAFSRPPPSSSLKSKTEQVISTSSGKNSKKKKKKKKKAKLEDAHDAVSKDIHHTHTSSPHRTQAEIDSNAHQEKVSPRDSPSSSSSSSLGVSIDLKISEEAICVMRDLRVTEMSVTGIVTLTLMPQDDELTVTVALGGAMTANTCDVHPYSNCIVRTGERLYAVRIASGCTSLPVLRYTVNNIQYDVAPLTVEPTCEHHHNEDSNTSTTLRIRLRKDPHRMPALATVSLLVTLSGNAHVSAIASSFPPAFFDETHQRVCWKASRAVDEMRAVLVCTEGDAHRVQLSSCLLAFSCDSSLACRTLSGLQVLIGDDPLKQYKSGCTRFDLTAKPFKCINN